jgi:predicted AAA+ superfamily ATPase
MKKTKITQGTVLTLDQEDKIEEQEKTIEIKLIWKWLIENK